MFRSSIPMSNDVLAKYVPSVFAETRNVERTSDRYTFIPTISVVDGLRKEGWNVYGAQQQMVRSSGRAAFAKHILRFRQEDRQLTKVGDSIAELIITNSHDGTSAYVMRAGLFRLVCSNGLTVSDGSFGTVRVKHSGNARHEVVDGAFKILNSMPTIGASVESMRAVTLTDGEQAAFADAALIARYGAETKPVEARQLLTARRWDDKSPDLWSTFNRVQENLVRGGITGRRVWGQRRQSVRAVTGIDTDTKLNQALWALAENMRTLKGQTA